MRWRCTSRGWFDQQRDRRSIVTVQVDGQLKSDACSDVGFRHSSTCNIAAASMVKTADYEACCCCIVELTR